MFNGLVFLFKKVEVLLFSDHSNFLSVNLILSILDGLDKVEHSLWIFVVVKSFLGL